MQIEDAVALKAGLFGLTMPLLTLPLSHVLPNWSAWAIAATVGTALFHWLPPRIHRDLTPVRSVAICVAAGITAGLINVGFDRVWPPN